MKSYTITYTQTTSAERYVDEDELTELLDQIDKTVEEFEAASSDDKVEMISDALDAGIGEWSSRDWEWLCKHEDIVSSELTVVLDD